MMKRRNVKTEVLGALEHALVLGGMEESPELLPIGKMRFGESVCSSFRKQVKGVDFALFVGPIDRHNGTYYIVREAGLLYFPGFSDFIGTNFLAAGDELGRWATFEWSLFSLLAASEFNPFNNADWSSYIQKGNYEDAGSFLVPCFKRLEDGVAHLISDQSMLDMILQPRTLELSAKLFDLNLSFVWQAIFGADIAHVAFRIYMQDVDYMSKAIDFLEQKLIHLRGCIGLEVAQWNWEVGNRGLWIPREVYINGLHELLGAAKRVLERRI